MPVLLLFLALGVLGFLWSQRVTTILTHDCRRRQDKAKDVWFRAICGAERKADEDPKDCLRG